MNKNIIIRNNESETIKDIEMKSLLSLEEELNLVKQVKDGDEEALNKLCTSNIRLVTSVAKQYADKGLSLDELIKAGNEGLVVAAEKFDVRRGFKFIPYATWWIRQFIMKKVGIEQPSNDVPSVTSEL